MSSLARYKLEDRENEGRKDINSRQFQISAMDIDNGCH